MIEVAEKKAAILGRERLGGGVRCTLLVARL